MRLDYFGLDSNPDQNTENEQKEIIKEKERNQELEIEKLTNELDEISKEEKWLDEMIGVMDGQLKDMASDELYEQFAYVTYDDIHKIYDNSTLLAIRAPPGTKLEIPDNGNEDQRDSGINSDDDKTEKQSAINMKPPSPVKSGIKERGIQTNQK